MAALASLLRFCRNGEVEKVTWLLNSRWGSSLDVNSSLPDGWNALHYSADRADARGTQVVQLLISRGCSVNAMTRQGATALMLAVDARNRATVKLLLETGAEPDMATPRGLTALHIAAKRGEPVLCRWLLTMGANVRLPSRTGRTPLHDAAASGADRAVSTLLHAGASVNAVEHVQGDAALHIAARAGHADVASTLLTWGADLTCRNVLRETAVETAVRHDRFVLAAALPRMLALHRRWWLVRLLTLISTGRAVVKRHRALLERFELLSRRCVSDGQLGAAEVGDGVVRSSSCPIHSHGADGHPESGSPHPLTTADVCQVVIYLARMPRNVWEVTLGFM